MQRFIRIKTQSAVQRLRIGEKNHFWIALSYEVFKFGNEGSAVHWRFYNQTYNNLEDKYYGLRTTHQGV